MKMRRHSKRQAVASRRIVWYLRQDVESLALLVRAVQSMGGLIDEMEAYRRRFYPQQGEAHGPR